MKERANAMDSAPLQASPDRHGCAAAHSPVRTRGLLSRFGKIASGTHALALADQGVASATSFFTTVLLARSAGSGQLGAYAIGVSLLACLIAVQDSLILLPYSIQRHHPTGSSAERAGACATLSGMLSAVMMAALILGALGLSFGGAESELVEMTLAMAAVAPLVLAREFGRKYAFAHLQMGRALLLDVVAAAVQIPALIWLSWSGKMSAVTACAALGAACGIASIGWLYSARAELALALGRVRTTIEQSWDLAKWLFVGRMTGVVQGYVNYWLLIAIGGAEITGIYAACMSVVSFANPLMFGLANVLAPKSVLAWKNGGGRGLRDQAIRDSLVAGAAMALFCIAVLFAGGRVMQFLYRGTEFEGLDHTLTVLAVAMLASALGAPASNGLASMERPRAIVAVGIAGAVTTVVLVSYLMSEWGLRGAAYGYTIGNVVGAAGRWIAFLALIPRPDSPAPARRALQKFLEAAGDRDCSVTRLGEGEHAVVYAARSGDGHPIWRGDGSLAVKVYKSGAELNEGMVREQFDALSRLNSALDGRTFGGWKIRTPRALYVCDSPLALVMTAVPGASIDTYAAGGEATVLELLDAAKAFAAAIGEGWSCGQIHGDLGLRNVLFDIQRKEISIIDPGTRESCRVCNGESKSQGPAALDLAHLLAELATDVTDMIGSPIVRGHKQGFVENVLLALMERDGKREEKWVLLDQVRRAAQDHLEKTLHISWSLRGVWHWLVKRIAAHRIHAQLARLEAALHKRRDIALREQPA